MDKSTFKRNKEKEKTRERIIKAFAIILLLELVISFIILMIKL